MYSRRTGRPIAGGCRCVCVWEGGGGGRGETGGEAQLRGGGGTVSLKVA